MSEVQKSIANFLFQSTGGSGIEYSYSDILLHDIPVPDNRTSEEIIEDMKNGLDSYGKEA